MDENLVMFAIQKHRGMRFSERYIIFDDMQTRDETYILMTSHQPPEIKSLLSRVELIIRVETEDDDAQPRVATEDR